MAFTPETAGCADGGAKADSETIGPADLGEIRILPEKEGGAVLLDDIDFHLTDSQARTRMGQRIFDEPKHE